MKITERRKRKIKKQNDKLGNIQNRKKKEKKRNERIDVCNKKKESNTVYTTVCITKYATE